MRDEVLKSDYRERSKLLIKQDADKPMVYSFIFSKLSLESESEVKRHPNYNTFYVTQDPLELWKALTQLHLTNTVSKNADFGLQQAENDYMTCNQGEFESITKFKERFNLKLKAYNNALDPALQVSDIRAAMAFLNKLHRTPYGQFYANKINIINTDATKVPANVNEVYVEAKAFITIVTTNKPNGTPVSFATTADNFLRSNKKKTHRGNNKNNTPTMAYNVPPSTTTTPHVSTVAEHHDQASGTSPNSNNHAGSNNGIDTSKIQCYNCQMFGHYARDCPTKDPLTVMTTGGKTYYQPQWYEVGLDTLSQVNVLNSRFLENIVPGQSSFKGLGNQACATSYLGSMAIFPGLECQVCDDCVASILSFAQIKKTGVKISYDGDQEMFTVHSKVGDLEFKQRGDLYLADFRPYITDRALIGMTTEEREAMFNKAMVKSAKEAGKFIKNAGYPSEQAAINLVRSGNIMNVPIEVQDVKNYFEVYGTPIAAIRGRTT